jgi:tripartite-type tricarboxylate transporter receptor subunit TctC
MLKAADFVEGLDKVGAEPAGGTPEQFAKTYRDESEGWKPLIRRAGIKPE